MWVYIIGILLFAIASAVLYAWGLNKANTQDAELMESLFIKGASKVRKHLKHSGVITLKEIEQEVTGIKASLFYSRKRVAVTNSREFAKKLVEYMQGQNQIEPGEAGGRKGYVLKQRPE